MKQSTSAMPLGSRCAATAGRLLPAFILSLCWIGEANGSAPAEEVRECLESMSARFNESGAVATRIEFHSIVRVTDQDTGEPVEATGTASADAALILPRTFALHWDERSGASGPRLFHLLSHQDESDLSIVSEVGRRSMRVPIPDRTDELLVMIREAQRLGVADAVASVIRCINIPEACEIRDVTRHEEPDAHDEGETRSYRLRADIRFSGVRFDANRERENDQGEVSDLQVQITYADDGSAEITRIAYVNDLGLTHDEDRGVTNHVELFNSMKFSDWSYDAARASEVSQRVRDIEDNTERVDAMETLIFGPVAEVDGDPQDLVSRAAPEIELQTMDGDAVAVPKDGHDRVVVLDFWTTWCAPCITAINQLRAIRDEWPGEGFDIYAVNLGEDERTVRNFVDRHGWDDIEILRDQNEASRHGYNIVGVPHTVTLDGEAVVRDVHVGATEQFQEHMEQVLRRIERSEN